MSIFSSLQNFPTSKLHIVKRTLLTMCNDSNGEVGNFVMTKKWPLLFYISNDNVTLTVTECFYKLNSFLHKIFSSAVIKFGANTCTSDRVMAQNLNFNVAARGHRYLSFSDMNFDGKTCCRTLFSVSISNLVRICSTMAELWLFN